MRNPSVNLASNIKSILRDHMNGTIVTYKNTFVNDFLDEKRKIFTISRYIFSICKPLFNVYR